MKHFNKIIIFAMVCSISVLPSYAQNFNWKSLKPSNRYVVSFHTNFDHATAWGMDYGYRLKTKMPIMLTFGYSLPFGGDVFDDIKVKLGGQVNIVRAGSFQTIVKAHGIIRRYSNTYARMVNFGSEFSANSGIYKKRWFLAAEVGFDKAITTHIKHSSLMKEYNPDVQSGWYIPTGGNFSYGIQAGYSFKINDVYARIGKTIEQDFKTQPMMPYYFEVGWNLKW